LEDVSKKDVQRASDALFPKGFYADPLSTTEKNSGPVKYFTKAV
jgi:hypothetical protein